MVVRSCMDYVREADPQAQTEVLGLSVVRPEMRLADIYTNAAVPNRDAAIDVTVVSPEAGYAGMDCVQNAFRRKLEKHVDVLEEWRGSNMTFQPMVWSHWGRPHHNTRMIMKHICGNIARKTETSSRDIERRWSCEIALTLALRRARMARRTLPARDARGRFVVEGEVGENILSLSSCWECAEDPEGVAEV